MTKDKWVFWDIGGVIASINYVRFVSGLSYIFSTTSRDIIGYFEEGNPPLWHEIEKSWSPKEIYSHMCAHFKKIPSPDLFEKLFNSILSEPVDELSFRNITTELSCCGVNQGIISNINEIHLREFEKTYAYLLGRIPEKHRFYSCRLALRKPDKKFYEMVFDRTGAHPKNSFFVDDRLENVQKFPGTGLLFFNYAYLDYLLARHGLCP